MLWLVPNLQPANLSPRGCGRGWSAAGNGAAASNGGRRLTVVSQFYPPDFAATGQLLRDLCERLARRDLQVQVLTGMPSYAYSNPTAERLSFEPNLCVRRTRLSRLWPRRIRGRAVNGVIFCARIALRLLRYARRGDLILYTSEPAYLPLLGWLLHQVTRTPYLVLAYDLYPDVLVELGVLGERHWLVRLWRHCNRRMLADARQVIVLSEPMAARLRRHVPEAAHKLAVISSWADPAWIQPRPKQSNWFVARELLGDRFTVLYSGNQGRCHDLHTLMTAARTLRHNPAVQFVFIRHGPQHHELVELSRAWQLDNCRFLPYQEFADLPYSLSSADLAIVSLNRQSEGLVAPSKLYGHLAAATPIAAITPAHSYLRELVEDAGCGRWFANGDAEALAAWILELKANPSQAATYGAAGRRLLERTATPELIADRYLALIQRHLPTPAVQPVAVPVPAGAPALLPIPVLAHEPVASPAGRNQARRPARLASASR